ncbi:MAG: hypothetical protein WD793_15160 [Steroidobacteraceae bacterium]
MQQLTIARLTTATIYRIFFLGLLFGCVPIFLVLGILGYFDLATLHWNNRPVTGLRAVIAGPFIGLLFALVGTAFFGSAAAVGLWLRSKFLPLDIQYVEKQGFDA